MIEIRAVWMLEKFSKLPCFFIYIIYSADLKGVIWSKFENLLQKQFIYFHFYHFKVDYLLDSLVALVQGFFSRNGQINIKILLKDDRGQDCIFIPGCTVINVITQIWKKFDFSSVWLKNRSSIRSVWMTEHTELSDPYSCETGAAVFLLGSEVSAVRSVGSSLFHKVMWALLFWVGLSAVMLLSSSEDHCSYYVNTCLTSKQFIINASLNFCASYLVFHDFLLSIRIKFFWYYLFLLSGLI